MTFNASQPPEWTGFRLFRRAPTTLTLPEYTRQRGLLANAAKTVVLVGSIALFCFVYGFGFAITAPYLIVPFVVPVAIVALIVIWALPDARSYPKRTLGALTVVFFIAAVVWPNYLAIAIPGMPWITMLRLIGAPLTLCLLICLSISKEFRAELSSSLQGNRTFTRLFVFFSLLATISIAISSMPVTSLNQMINFHVSCTSLFFAAAWFFRSEDKMRLLTNVVIALVLVTCMVGIAESQTKQVLWANSIPSFLKVDDPQVERVLSGWSRGTVYRVSGFWSTPLACAEFLAICVPFLLHIAVFRKAAWLRALAGLLVVASLAVILATDSRLGLVGALLAGGVFCLLWALRRRSLKRNDLIAPAMILTFPITAAIGLASTFFIYRLRVEFWGTSYGARTSDQGRQAQLELGIPKILDQPWGHGPARAAEVLGYRSPGGQLTIDNHYLAIALDYGIVGFAIYIAMFACILYFCVKGAVSFSHAKSKESSALMIAFTSSFSAFFLIKSVLAQIDNHPAVYLLMGAALATYSRLRHERTLSASSGAEHSERVRGAPRNFRSAGERPA